MASTLILTFITLTIWVKAIATKESDPRLEKELECLSKSPAELCDLEVTFPGRVKTLACDYLVPESSGQYLQGPPQLHVEDIKDPVPRSLLLMFDPDAPMSENPSEGFIHWLALISINRAGNVTIGKVLTDYYPPTPPRGDPPHRYQVFIFQLAEQSDVKPVTGRKFELCPFLDRNDLVDPMYAFQFRYQRE